MGYVQGCDRNQIMLLPNAVEDYIAEDNEVRFIDAFIDSLDMKKLDLKYSQVCHTGRRPYDPSDMLKLYCYGYLNAIRSSRKLERECNRNLEVIWLMNNIKPDYRTIADFRKNNKEKVKLVFKELVKLCKKLELYGNEVVAIDGSKIKAVNAKQRNFTKDILSKRIKEIEEKIDKYIEELDKNDELESENDNRLSAEDLREKIKSLKERKHLYIGYEKHMQELEEDQISLTDGDSRRMLNNQRYEICYNVQATVESKNKLILDYEVTNQVNDAGQLKPMAINAKKELEVKKLEVLADKGYYSAEDMKGCIDEGITPYVPKRNNHCSCPDKEYAINNFKYDIDRDVYICPEKHELEFKKSTMYRNKKMKVYLSTACMNCNLKNKCTKKYKGREIQRWEHETLLENLENLLKKNLIKYKQRKCIIEHVFGTIKRALNGYYVLMKGLNGASADVGFMMMSYNMRRMINIIGIKNLIAAI